MPIAHVNGIDIYYEEHGQGTPLVLAHGFTGSVEEWREKVRPLASRHRLLLYDARGHGQSSAPEDPAEYSMPVLAADQAALMQALGVERAHVGGVSMGGMIASQFVLDYPQMATSFLLCDSTAGNGADRGPAGEFERFLANAFSLMEHIAVTYGFEELHRRMDAYNQQNDPHYGEYPEPPEVGLQWLLRMSMAGYVGANRAIRKRPDLSARLGEVTVPTLVLVGEWDRFLPCGQLAHRRLPNSRYVLARRSGHGIVTWRPDAFQRAVLDFLADVDAGRDVRGEYEL